MSEFPTKFDTPEDAYFGFFRADSAKNAEAWAAVMSYPHVRVSAIHQVQLYADASDYAARANWTAREATGWVRSEGIPPVRHHESPKKVHLLGGWTRFNAAGEPVLSNRVTYILTKIDESWGIQARFGVDSFSGKYDTTTAAAAESIVSKFIEHLGKDELAPCARLCRFPLTVVGVGSVHTINREDEFTALFSGYRGRKTFVREVKALQAGSRGAVITLTTGYNEGADEQAIVVVGQRENSWLIAGASGI